MQPVALRAHALAQEYEKVAGKSSSQSREQFRALLVSAGVACAAAPIGKTVPDLACTAKCTRQDHS